MAPVVFPGSASVQPGGKSFAKAAIDQYAIVLAVVGGNVCLWGLFHVSCILLGRH